MATCECGSEIPSGGPCPRCHPHSMYWDDAAQEIVSPVLDVGYIEMKVGFVKGFSGRACSPGDPLPPGWVRGSYVRSMLSSRAEKHLLRIARVDRELFEGWMVEKRHADSLLKVMHEDRPDLVAKVPRSTGCAGLLLIALGALSLLTASL